MIPVLDWRDATNDRAAFREALGKSVRETGFFLLTHPMVSADLRAKVFAMADRFFDQPRSDKAQLSILDTPHYRGWAAPGDESLDETRPEVDTKESFNIGYDLAPDDPRVLANAPFRGVNRWPDIPGFDRTMLDYYEACHAQALGLLSVMAEDLGLPGDHFEALFVEPLSAMRLLRYPPGTGARGEIGAGAHTDYGAITLLMTDGEAGLQVRPRVGDWVDVPHVSGAYVVNIGDCLMRWTNDIYVSTPHRVLPPQRQRQSVAFFCEANPDTVVMALSGTGVPKYPPIRAADYLASRLQATYAEKKEDP